ncbi:Hypothetical predicted protein [Mytilus galloprovincialis]|uniref:Uncharacterized protein n=1 Tax=Mytilus galloprovincialis TaxID=29158 RepID=A0A8B6CAG5_MYTGA|nr:Hypothetical predicted protein [Mytilus galloprovincialis]
MDEEVNNLLTPIYYNIENPSSFSSASKLYHIVNADGKKIGYHKIKRWLNAQDNYSLQKTPRRSFRRLRVYTTGIGNLMDVDLMQVNFSLTKYKDDNNINGSLSAVEIDRLINALGIAPFLSDLSV